MGEPFIYNKALLRGIYGDKIYGSSPAQLQMGILKDLRVKDETEFVRRFNWYNLPSGITGDLIERILYYKGEGIMFYVKELEQFYFLPFVMEGGFDVYGRYSGVRAVPFTGESEVKEGNKTAWISNFPRKPKYSIVGDEWNLDDALESCVILRDYTQQISQHIQPRAVLQEPILKTMSECIPFMRTRLIADTGVKGMRVSNADDQENVTIASRNIVGAALEGDMYIPIVGTLEFQEMTNTNGGSAVQEYMMAFQSLDNLRKANLGIASSGVFEKSAHTLESEQAMNASSVDLVLQDAITLRQQFCNIFNSIFGLGIWVEPSETLVMADINGDGVDYDREEGNVEQQPEYQDGGSEDE